MIPLIGDPLPRVDGRLKVTGGARYAAEVPVANVAHAVLVPSSIARGRIAAVDDSAACRAGGILAIITYRNAPRLNRPKFIPAGQSFPLLQNPDIHYFGQPVAVVVAETLEQAVYGASLMRVEYRGGQPATDIVRQMSEAYQPDRMQTGLPAASRRGDVGQALLEAAFRHDAVYTTPFEHHNPLEPHASVAVWRAGKLTVYDSTQGVGNVRRALSQILGLDPRNVRVVSHFLGGGFGCKGQSWPHTALACVAARVVDRPVKLALTRPQMFFSNGHRPTTVQKVELGVGEDSKLRAVRHATVNHTSVADNFVEPSGHLTQFLYSCSNVDVSHRLVRLNTGTPTFTRAPGFASGSYALECAMDEMAYKLGLDPIEFRLRNYAERDEHEDRPWSSKSLRACYEQGAAKFGWDARAMRPASLRRGRLLVGYGMASAGYPAHFRPAAARATIARNGAVRVQCATQDIGTGTYTVLAQLAAEVLGVPLEQVRFELGDTRLPEAPASTGSATVSSAGPAVYEAALNLRNKLVAIALEDARSPLAGVPLKDIQAANGRIHVAGHPDRGEAYSDLLGRHGRDFLSAEGEATPGPEQGHERPERPGGGATGGRKPAIGRHSYNAFGAQFCEVEVDPDLGAAHVVRMTGAFAGGRVLNARTARSQLMGGMVWGIGMALLEETRMDYRRGCFINANLAEYLIPVNADVPSIDVILIGEEDSYVNPLGAKGLGEIGIVGAAAAIANAVFHATGKRIRDLPITVEKLLV